MFRFTLLTFGALCVSTAALAHVVFDQPRAQANAYYAGFVRISHGCGASPTRTVRVEIPDGVNIVRPQPKPGWTLTIEHAPLATPIRTEGGYALTERVTPITWSGELPADQFDMFGIMMRLPDRGGPLYFPVVQTCAEGEQRWTDIPAEGAAWNSVPHPAAVITLESPPPSADASAHHH